jgi:UDP-glucose 4-epimerase
MRVLVTGGMGFIGSNLKEQLEGKYDILSPPSTELDLLDENRVRDFVIHNRCDVVLHTATWNATKTSSKDTSRVLANNLKMFFNLARCSHHYGKMIYFGSGAEYDRRFWVPRMREDYFDTHVPVDDYGYSKYVMRKYVAKAENIYELCLFGVFGKNEDWRIRFISNACCKAIWDLPITIKQNVFFDYLYIDDLAKVTDWFIENQSQGKVYNVCTGRALDFLTLAKRVLEVSGKNLEINIAEEGRGREYSGDNGKLMKEIGNYGFKEMTACIQELYAWYSENRVHVDRNKLSVN